MHCGPCGARKKMLKTAIRMLPLTGLCQHGKKSNRLASQTMQKASGYIDVLSLLRCRPTSWLLGSTRKRLYLKQVTIYKECSTYVFLAGFLSIPAAPMPRRSKFAACCAFKSFFFVSASYCSLDDSLRALGAGAASENKAQS
jgi:hypothetical protein